jgi:hypothetical protein
MKRLGAAVASLLVCMAIAAPAMAQTGNGLYEPFPAAASKARAKRFVSELPGVGGRAEPVSVSDRQLQRGVIVDPRALRTPAPAAGLASSRARGATGFAPSFGWPLALVLAALALATPFALAARRS